MSRTIDALAADTPAALRAIHAGRAEARRRVWGLARQHGPAAGITAASPLAVMLRAGNAGSNTAADHVSVIREALRQLPFHAASTSRRAGRKVLIRIDGAGGHARRRELHGRAADVVLGRVPLPDNAPELLKLIPDSAWTPAYDSDGQVRDGARVAELTGLLELDKNKMAGGNAGHCPQLRINDIDGHRVTANTRPGGPGTQLPDLELRHRRRARCENQIRGAKDTGQANLPLHDWKFTRTDLNQLLTRLGRHDPAAPATRRIDTRRINGRTH